MQGAYPPPPFFGVRPAIVHHARPLPKFWIRPCKHHSMFTPISLRSSLNYRCFVHIVLHKTFLKILQRAIQHTIAFPWILFSTMSVVIGLLMSHTFCCCRKFGKSFTLLSEFWPTIVQNRPCTYSARHRPVISEAPKIGGGGELFFFSVKCFEKFYRTQLCSEKQTIYAYTHDRPPAPSCSYITADKVWYVCLVFNIVLQLHKLSRWGSHGERT